MKQEIILILLWSSLLAVGVFASPPTGIIAVDSNNNIGVATNTPATAIDINGTTTIRKSLDMTNNFIINIATPTSSLDAANKAYVDTQIANISSTTVKIWGEGRTSIAVINTAGECTRVISGKTVKISRSTRPATWDRAQAACPAGWWVCSAADRGTVTCGSGKRTYVECNQRQNPTPTYLDDLTAWLTTNGSTWGWVSNTGTTADGPWGGFVDTAGVLSQNYSCNIMPVWCCS